VLEQPADDLRAMQDRCLDVTRTRYNWETAVAPYLSMLRPLAGGPGGADR
jgi:hypothetical protein